MERLRFRITPWPDVRLPHPDEISHDTYELEDGRFLSLNDWAIQDGPDVSLGEVYLRVVDLDLLEPHDVLDFVNTFGILGVRRNRFREFSGLIRFADMVLPELMDSWSARTHQQWRKALREDAQMPPGEETLAEFMFGARWIKDVFSAWQVLHEDTEPSEIEWASTWWSAVTRSRAQVPDSYDLAAFLQWGLDAALQHFHPRLLVGLPSLSEIDDNEGSPVWEDVTLFCLCALELFDHIAEEADYRRCGNETCGRLFVRQAGRADQRQHRLRGGLKYCSRACANAQMQRESRRRRQAAKTSTKRTERRRKA